MRIPTSVAAFDTIVKGGIPSGSVIILAGEPGSGYREFSFTSAAKLAMARNSEEFRRIMIEEAEDIYIPKGTAYISFSRSEKEVMRSVDLSFNPDLAKAFRDNLVFKDFSVEFFKHSIVPPKWVVSSSISEYMKKKGDLLKEFVSFMDAHSNERVVIVDSLTDLLTSPRINTTDLIDVIRGLRRKAKEWDTVIYLLLTLGVLEPREESILFDSVDGVMVFQWHTSTRYSKRYRYMYVLKFVGLMANLEEERIARFNTTLNKRNGFVVVNTEKIG
ncbi:MAG: recombinase RecA [Euryarchaeota archaeon]|nr:recombinase RecA [Euryarchaeota archaeon]